jgi:phosphoglycolate phosphatase-like HAD superfamily hydrolase
VGDDDRDRQAAEAAGCPFVFAGSGEDLPAIVDRLLAETR